MFSDKGVEDIVNSILLIIRQFDWLLDLSVVNFYKDDHWERLPANWKDILQDIEPPEFVNLLDRKQLERKVWPLSLLALQSVTAQYSLPRLAAEAEDQVKNFGPWRDICSRPESVNTRSVNTLPVDGSTACTPEKVPKRGSEIVVGTTSCLTHPKLRHMFRKHVKLKKCHEIDKFARIVAETARSVNVDHVIDVGSGVGHLSRTLAYGYALKVCGVERQEKLTRQAVNTDLVFEAAVARHVSNEDMENISRPVHLNHSLDHQTNQQQLIQRVCSAFGVPSHSDLKCGIVGLHTCGDLTPVLLKLFALCPNILFVSTVGCCFMKLTAHKNVPSLGYPMSRLLSQRLDAELSYEALEVACHANETYWQRLRDGLFDHLNVNCYRAVLEDILSRRFPDLQSSVISSVKFTPQLSFADYCTHALSRYNVSLPTEDVSSARTLQYLSEWKRVVNLTSLRLLLAPLVETLVLLDRLLYVREQGFNSVLLPIFDPRVSPRNHVIIATKNGYIKT